MSGRQPPPRKGTAHPQRTLSSCHLSMDFRLADRRGAFEEIEVAALVGLLDVAREDRAVTPLELSRRLLPRRLSLAQFFFGNFQVELALLDIELDEIAGLRQRERTADVRLRRDVQH